MIDGWTQAKSWGRSIASRGIWVLRIRRHGRGPIWTATVVSQDGYTVAGEGTYQTRAAAVTHGKIPLAMLADKLEELANG